MEERASGIILRTRRMTETSLVVHWLTEDLGRISTVAKGALRPKSPFLGKLDLFYEAEFSFVRSRRSELHNLCEARVRESQPALRQDIDRLNQAAYFVMLIEKSTESEAPVPKLYHLLRESLQSVASRTQGHEPVFTFELKLLSQEGYEPRFDSLSKNAREACEASLALPFESAVAKFDLLTPKEKHQLAFLLERALGAAFERIPPQRSRALRS